MTSTCSFGWGWLRLLGAARRMWDGAAGCRLAFYKVAARKGGGAGLSRVLGVVAKQMVHVILCMYVLLRHLLYQEAANGGHARQWGRHWNILGKLRDDNLGLDVD